MDTYTLTLTEGAMALSVHGLTMAEGCDAMRALKAMAPGVGTYLKAVPATPIEKCPDCNGTGHSGNLDDECCSTCGGGGRADGR